ncbi:MAG: LptF/LptG family permease [Cyanobacteria bacterium J06623_7]
MKFNLANRKYSYRVPLLDRYLIQQLSWFFGFSVSIFTALGVAVGTVGELAYKIAEYQLPIPVAILVFCCKIPEYAAYGLPISILLTGLIIYSRLNRDRELTALLSFGISFYRLILPALVFSLIITGITFVLNELVVPAANYRANLLQSSYLAKTELNLQRQDIYYTEYQSESDGNKQLQQLYFAERFIPPKLIAVTIISFNQEEIASIVTAESALWLPQQQVWRLEKGSRASFARGRENTLEDFELLQLPFSKTMFEIVNRERSAEAMNIRQAREYLSLIEDSGASRELAKLAVRIQQKYAFPFICVVFISIGAALGSQYAGLDRGKCLALCVGIVFAYYCLGFTSGSLGITGALSPFWAAWLPNLAGLAVGLYLVDRVSK